MNPAVQGYTAAVLDEVRERPALAADLAAVEAALEGNVDLRAALTDVAVPAPARRAVLSELLAGKVSDPARRLAAYAAGAVHGQDVPAAVAWVASRARHAAEGRDDPEQLLGHRQARQRVGGFAAAVYEEVAAAELEEIEDELFRFARTVASTPALRAALGNADLPAPARTGIVHDLLAGKVHAGTLRLASYAVVGGRARDIVGTLDWLAEQTAVARGWRVAKVRAGQEVDDEERRRLSETLARLAGWPVELQVTVERSLLAGVDVEIGDLRLEATARGRLDRLREHVLTGGWTDQGFGRLERGAHGSNEGT